MTSHKAFFQFVLLAFSCTALFIQCNREPVSWHTQQEAPLASIILTLSDILPENLDTSTAGVLIFHYADTLFQFGLDSFLTLPDTTVTTGFSLPILGSITVPEDVNIISLPNELRIVANGAQLTHAALDSGWVDLEVFNPFDGTFNLVYTLPTVVLNGQAVSIGVTVPPGTPENPSITRSTVLLHGAAADLTGEDGDTFNELPYVLTLSTAANAGTATLTGGDSLLINSTYRAIQPSYAQGYFGQLNESYSDTVSTDLEKLISADFFEMDSGSVQLTIFNEFGADFQVVINSLTAFSSSGSNELSYPQLGLPINVSRATQAEDVLASTQVLDLGSANSNVMELFSTLPEELAVSAQVALNPLGNVSNNFDFAYGDGTLTLLAEASIPLRFGASNLRFRDTLRYSPAPISEQLPSVDELTFYMRCENHFLLTFGGSVTLLDAHNIPIDTLEIEPEIEAAYSSAQPRETWLTLPSKLTSLNFQQINRVALEFRVTTLNAQPVTVTTGSRIDIDLSTNAQVLLEVN